MTVEAQIVSPFPIMTDLNGKPLDDGFVYIGTSGLNPEVNPITVYWDLGLTESANQPIRTIGGYLSKNGSPGNLFMGEDDYSITVRDKHGVLVFTSLSAATVDFTTIPWSSITGQVDSDRVDFIQNLTGATTRTVESKLRDVINVKDFGAVGDGVADDTAAIQAAVDAIDNADLFVTGGIIYIPTGRYKISSTIIVRTTLASGEYLTSVTLRGDGIHNTILDCDAGFIGTDALYLEKPNYCAVEDLFIDGNDAVTNGLHVEDGSQIRIIRVNVEEVTGSCFLIDRSFMITMSQCRSRCDNGLVGFDFSGGYNTSLYISNCYANNTDTTGMGFKIYDVSYSTFVSCACDNVGRQGYWIANVKAVTFISCGCEVPGRAAFHFEASAALDTAAQIISGCRCTLIECFSHLADADLGGFGSVYSNQIDTSFIDVELIRFREHSNSGSVSVFSGGVSLDHRVKLSNCDFVDSIKGVAAFIQETNIIRVNDLSITGLNVPVIDLQSVFGSPNMYSGLLHIIATSGTHATNGSLVPLASYLIMVTKTGANEVTLIASDGLTSGTSASDPSFTWTLRTAGSLEATPIGSTSGNFYFYITQLGGLTLSNV